MSAVGQRRASQPPHDSEDLRVRQTRHPHLCVKLGRLTIMLAIDGGTPIHASSWPSPHEATPQDLQQLQDVLRSETWSEGEKCRKFERAFAERCGTAHAVL